MSFQPDYRNMLDAAWNRVPKRLPLYEHLISDRIMEQALDTKFVHLYHADNDAYFREYCRFYKEMGYDTVSHECWACDLFPGSGALGKHKPGIIQDRESFERYPWDEIEDRFFAYYEQDYQSLRNTLPEGMRAVGGVGNGVFECVQDLVGYTDLCYIREDDPELYADLFKKVGEVLLSLWKRVLRDYGDLYCIGRFGDDLGFKSTTLLHPQDIRDHVIPAYKPIIDLIHSYGKPFLFHSCGNIFNVMDDLIAAGINGKHSNEDQIALFPEWVERYGDRIGNFGGIDTDAVCRLPKDEMTAYIEDVIRQCQGHGGFAFGSGNSIPDYVPIDQYLHMLHMVRTIRGDYAE